MTIPTITQTLDPPLITDDRTTFDSKAFEVWTDFGTACTQINATAAAMNTVADEVDADATAAADSADAASNSATAAAASAASAANAPGTSATSTTSLTVGIGSKSLTIQTGKAFAVGQTVVIASSASPTNQMTGLVTAHNNTTGALTVDVERADGAGTYANWVVALAARPIAGLDPSGQSGKVLSSDGTNFAWITSKQALTYTTRTSNVMLGASDHGKFFDLGGSAFTQTFDACATLGSGWYCFLRASASAKTLDPSGSETIDGVATGRLVSGQVVLVMCDGTNLQAASIQSSPITEVLTSGTSWTCPVGVRSVNVHAVGGGGNGSGAAGAGGGGGTAIRRYSTTPATTYTYAIGAAGIGGGSSGGNTTFTDGTAAITASGGVGGTSANPGGAATGGDINIRGQSGFGSSPYFGGGSTLGTGGCSSTGQTPSGYGGGNCSSTGFPTAGVIVLTY